MRFQKNKDIYSSFALIIYVILITLIIGLQNSYAQSKATSSNDVIPLQVYDLTKMTHDERNKWIVYAGRLDKPVIVEVAGANSEEFWITVGKTMRGLQYGGLSNLVLVKTNDSKYHEQSDEVIFLYERGKLVTVFENPPNDISLKVQLQEIIMKLYDRVHGTNFLPLTD